MRRLKRLAYFLAFLVTAGALGALTVTKTWVPAENFTAADINGAFDQVETWANGIEGAGFLVTTANATLTGEVAVGATPGGELGGSWASPTLDDGVTVDGWVMGVSTGTTPAASDNSTKLATTAFVASAAPLKIGNGTIALGTSSIASAGCASVVTSAVAGVATTDTILWGWNGDVSGVTGYTPATTGGLSVYVYPSAGFVNAKVCNPTASAITPGAVTLNYRVVR